MPKHKIVIGWRETWYERQGERIIIHVQLECPNPECIDPVTNRQNITTVRWEGRYIPYHLPAFPPAEKCWYCQCEESVGMMPEPRTIARWMELAETEKRKDIGKVFFEESHRTSCKKTSENKGKTRKKTYKPVKPELPPTRDEHTN